MADAFRGLTLKLGADSRPVVSAINSIKASAGQANTQLNAMNKALRFNSSNAAAMQARLDLIGDKASLAARQAATISKAMQQAAGQTVKFSSSVGVVGGRLDKVAGNVREAYSATQKLRSEYVHVEAQLQHIHDAAARIAKQEMGFKKLEDANKHIRELAKGMSAANAPINEARASMEHFIRVASMEGGLSEKFGLKHTFTDAKKLVGVYDELKAKHVTLQGDLEAMNKVEGFRALRTQAIAARAELRQAASEAARFSSELHALGASGELARPLAYIQRMSEAAEKATAEARQMKAQYDAMPRSMEAIKARMAAASAAEATYKARLDSINTALKKVESAPGFDKQAASSERAYVEAMKVEQAYENVTVKLKGAEAASEMLNAELATMRDEGVSETSAEFVKLQSRIEAVDKEVLKWKAHLASVDDQHAAASMVMQWRKLKTEAAAVKTELAGISASTSKLNIFSGLGDSLREFGYGLYSTVTPAIMIAGRYGIQAANDIDSAWRDMRKTVNGTEEEFQQLKDAALAFSQTHVTTADTILEIEAMGGQLGIAAQNLEGFSEVVSNLDIATDIDAEDLAKYIGQLSNIMSDFDQSNPEEYQRQITSFSDSLVRLGNNSAAQESSIMKVMMRIASLGEISDMTTPDLLAISTAVAATGQGCEAAGTAISKTFSNIEAAVGAGGDKLDAFAAVAGMSAEQFAKSWTETPTQAFTAFIEGLKRIDQEGGSVDSTLTDLKITSVRQKQALMGLTNTLDVLHDSLTMSNDAWNGQGTLINGAYEQAGDAAREAQRKSEGFSGELAMMKNNAMSLANEMASGAVPIIRDLGDNFETLTNVVKGMPDEMRTALVGLAAITAMAGPIGVWSGTTVNAFKGVRTAAGKAQEGLLLASASINPLQAKSLQGAKAMSKLSKGLQLIASPGGLLAIAGIGIAVDGITEAVGSYLEHMRKSENATKTVFNRMGIAIQQTADIAEDGSMRVMKALDFGSVKQTRYEWVENQSDAFDNLQQKAKQTFADNALIKSYADKIAEFMRVAEQSEAHILNPQQQAELQAAVDAYNQATGESISITDLERAKLKDSHDQAIETADAFERLAEKKRLAAMQDYLNEEYAENYKAAKEAADNLADAQQRLRDLEKEKAYIDATGLNFNGEAVSGDTLYYQQLCQAIEETRSVVDGYSGDLNRLKGDLEGTNELQTIAAKAASDTGTAIDSMLAGLDGFDSVKITSFLSHSGQSIMDFADALDSLGPKAQNLNADQVYSLAQSWDGTYASIMPKLQEYGVKLKELDTVKIGGKSFYVTDNGTIFNKKGELEEFQTFTVDDKHYYVTDDGTVYSEKSKLDGFKSVQIGNKSYLVTDEGTVYDEESKLAGLREMEILDKQYYVSDDGSVYDEVGKLGVLENTKLAKKFVEVGDNDTANSVKTRIMQLENQIKRLPIDTRTDISTNAPSATAEINGTYDALQKLKRNNTANVRINVNRSENAVGGVAQAAIRSIPRHATGAINGIVARPTLTNIGWTGEAGAEAILHMRNAGGAVIPLSNRRYVRPFARAVAAEMGGGQTVVNNYYSVNGVSYSEGSDGAAAVKELVHVTRVDRRRRGAQRGR